VSVHLDRMDRAAHRHVADVTMDADMRTEFVMPVVVSPSIGETRVNRCAITAWKDVDLKTVSVMPEDVSANVGVNIVHRVV
jgi:hypothetical protein